MFTDYDTRAISKEITTLRRMARKSHKGNRVYFDAPVIRVHQTGATLVIPFRVSDDIEAHHETGCAL